MCTNLQQFTARCPSFWVIQQEGENVDCIGSRSDSDCDSDIRQALPHSKEDVKRGVYLASKQEASGKTRGRASMTVTNQQDGPSQERGS